MKICHLKAMKLIKEYEEQKRLVLRNESNNSEISYKEGEEKIVSDYNYEQTRKQIEELDNKVRKIRVALAKSNNSTIIEDCNISISEALILLAQLESQKRDLEYLYEGKKQVSRSLTSNDIAVYTEYIYDIKKVKEDAETLRCKISDLQIAIDRANLTTFIEV